MTEGSTVGLTLAGRRLGAEGLALGIVAVGLALRLAWALSVPIVPVSDSVAYQTFAVTLAEHGVYGFGPEEPTAFWAVGTSAVLAACLLLFDDGLAAFAVVQALISGLAVWLTWRLGRLWISERAGLAAAVIVALWPSLILYTTVIASDATILTFALGGALAFESRWRRPWLGVLVAGLVWGAGVYFRPVVLLLPFVLVLAGAVRGRRALLPGIGRAVLVVAVMLACVAPWTARNHAVFGKPVLMSTNFGANLWMGNNPATGGGYTPMPDRVMHLDEASRDTVLRDEAVAYILADPAGFAARTGWKLVSLHGWETIAVAWNAEALRPRIGHGGVEALKLVTTGYWYLALGLGLGGVVVLARRSGVLRTLFSPMLLSWGYFAAVHAIIVVGDRYHFPVIPFVAMFGGLALTALAGRVAGPARGRPAAHSAASDPGSPGV